MLPLADMGFKIILILSDMPQHLTGKLEQVVQVLFN